jgi:hypothetical protein
MTPKPNYKMTVFCSLQFDGIHAWYTCPIKEVDFLKVDHRHMFHVKAYKTVNHDDRDVEFIQLKHEIQEYIRETYWFQYKRTHYLGAKSCEMLAIELIEKFDLCKCEVNEDNENGSIVEV